MSDRVDLRVPPEPKTDNKMKLKSLEGQKEILKEKYSKNFELKFPVFLFSFCVKNCNYMHDENSNSRSFCLFERWKC